MITIVNLTPHAVAVSAPQHPTVTFPPAGPVARVREVIGEPVIVTTPGGEAPIVPVRYAVAVDDLPEPADGVLHLVSRVTAAAVPRPDLVFPQGEIRDGEGRIVGCLALGTFHPLVERSRDA